MMLRVRQNCPFYALLSSGVASVLPSFQCVQGCSNTNVTLKINRNCKETCHVTIVLRDRRRLRH